MPRLWLDDIRNPLNYGIDAIWAKSSAEAISILESKEISFAYLDHDLGGNPIGPKPENIDEDRGELVILWMLENNLWPSDGIRIISMNPSASVRMIEAVRDHYGSYPFEWGPPPRVK